MSTLFNVPAHGFVADDPVVFGNCYPDPTTLVEGLTYYVLATDLTADAFRVSETVGGTALSLTAELDEFVVAAANSEYTPITDPDDVMSPPVAPAAPTSFALTSDTEIDQDGHTVQRLDISLVQPTSATLHHSVVTIVPAVGSNLRAIIPVGQTTASIRGVKAGVLYTGHANAYDTYGLVSVDSNTDTETPTGDTTAPAQVTGAAAFGAILGLIVGWGQSAAADLSHYEVQLDDNSGFASPDTYRIKGTVLALQQIAAGTWYFRIRAVDQSGNAGSYSSTVSATSRTVQTADLTDALITTAKLVAGAVTSVELADAAVIAAKVAVDAIGTTKIIDDAITNAKIGAAAVGTTEIDALAVTTAKLAAGAVTAAKITAGTITSNEIAALTIVAANIAAGTIVASKIAAGTITTNEIAALTIVAANIAAGTITGAKIAAGTITASNIAADTITANEIAASAITSSELAANAVIAGKILAGTIVTGDLNATCSISLVSNSGATVVIDATGITISDGKLILKDAFGATVMGSTGFAGSWLSFLRSGLVYNADFVNGDTSDIAVTEVGTGSSVADYAASITTHLPYWVVSASGGTVKKVTDTGATGGFALELGATASGQTNRIYQDVVCVPTSGHTVLVNADTIWTTGTVDFNIYASYRDKDHAIIGSRSKIGDHSGLNYDTGGYVSWLDDTYDTALAAAPVNAVYVRIEIETVHNSTSGQTIRLGNVQVIPSDLFAAYGIFSQEVVVTGEIHGTNINASSGVDIASGKLTLGGDVAMERTATKTLTIDDNAGGNLTELKPLATLLTLVGKLRFGLVSVIAAVVTEGQAVWDDTWKALFVGDSVNAKGVTPAGWQLQAVPYNYAPTDGTVTAALAAVSAGLGGTLVVPILVTAPMVLDGYLVRNGDTASTRACEIRLYYNQKNNSNSWTYVPASAAADSFTASAASTRTIALTGGAITIPPGQYLLAIRNTSTTQTWTYVRSATTILGAKTAMTKSIAALTTTIDIVTATWSGFSGTPHAALRGQYNGNSWS